MHTRHAGYVFARGGETGSQTTPYSSRRVSENHIEPSFNLGCTMFAPYSCFTCEASILDGLSSMFNLVGTLAYHSELLKLASHLALPMIKSKEDGTGL